jgi:protein-S-isoprenylcysteine O-methyltransferase Ste14
MTRFGGWLFRHRTSIPLPIVAALLIIPASSSSRLCLSWPPCPAGLAGLLAVLAGELLRLWAVRHIGVISRTRSDRIGPLIESGPFAFVRNPLYLGNILLWLGFTLVAHLIWLAPIVVALLAFEYHAIVRWEEQLIETRVGLPYRAYRERVPRWLPRFSRSAIAPEATPAPTFSWSDTLFSERGTLFAIAAGFALLAIKDRS